MAIAAIIEYGNREQLDEVRPAHRAYLAGLHAAGQIVVSGPFTDDSGALIVYAVDDLASAERLLRDDPFHSAGVFAAWSLRPWRRTL